MLASSKLTSLVATINNRYSSRKSINKTKALSYQELLNDAHLSACIASRKAAVLSYEYEFSCENQIVLEFIQQTFNSLNIYSISSQMLDALMFGFEVFEYYWRVELSKLKLVGIVNKPAEWFEIDDNGLTYFVKNFTEKVLLSKDKFLVLRNNPSYNNPLGEAIVDKCRPWIEIKKVTAEDWARLVQKRGIPFINATIEEGASDEEMEELADQLFALQSDGVAVTTSNVDLKMLEADKASSSQLFKDFLDFANSEISKAILGHSAAADSTPGKLGNENTTVRIREDILYSDMLFLERAFNEVVRIIVELNFGKGIECKFKYKEDENLQTEKANRDLILKNTGIAFTKEYYKRHYGLEEDEFELAPVTTPAFEEDEQEAPQDQTSSAVKKVNAVQVLDNISTKLSTKTNLIKQIESLTKGNSFEEVLSNLDESGFDTLNFEDIEKTLTNVFAISNLLGYAKGTEDSRS